MRYIAICFLLVNSFLLSATEFTISTYNCGGLSNHYDYLRAACMESLIQERYNAEPEKMAANENIQKLALKILFSTDETEKALAQQEWKRKGYDALVEELSSSSQSWFAKAEAMISSYTVRPVVINDTTVLDRLEAHLNALSPSEAKSEEERIEATRAVMASRIFSHHMNYDIICLQEADYLDTNMFPSDYTVLFSNGDHLANGIAWKTSRFELLEDIGDIMGRAYAVKLLDKESGKTVLVASGHISGCNPYRIENNPATGTPDSAKGDGEIQTVVSLFDEAEADLMLIGMDSNVTSLHPRLHILKDAGYRLDYENFLDPTCANPNLVLNTRIDWIALKTSAQEAAIVNIPVLSVGLNNILSNISDHKPIAAKVSY